MDNISSKSFNPFHELDLEALSYHIKMSVVPYIEDSISLASEQNTKVSQGILYKHTIPASLRKKPILKAAAKVRYWIVFKIENLAEIISQLPDYQEFTVDRKREYLKFTLEDIMIGNNDFFKDVYKLPIMDRFDPKNEWIATEKYRKLSHEWAIVVKDAVNDSFENNYSKLWLMLTPSKTGTFSLLTDGIKVYPPKFIESQKEEEEDADFKCRPGTSWKEIKISLVSNEMITIQTPTWQKRFTFHKLGLADGRKGDSPTIPWKRLIQLCENNGVLNDNLCNDSKSKNLDSQLRVLAKKFKLLLGINDRFRYYSKGRQLYVALPQFEDKREGNRTTDKPEEYSIYQDDLLGACRKARPEKF